MHTRATPVAAAALGALGGLFVAPAASAHDVHYTGSAVGIKGTFEAATITKSVTVTEVLMACSGTPREETLSALSNPLPIGLSANNVHAYTVGVHNVAASNADIESFKMSLADNFRVEATGLQSRAEATCEEATRRVTTDGSSDVGSLTINGQRQALSGSPNQAFEVPGLGKVVVNEQVQVSAKELIVTALHVYVADASYPANGDLAFARSRAKITCTK